MCPTALIIYLHHPPEPRNSPCPKSTTDIDFFTPGRLRTLINSVYQMTSQRYGMLLIFYNLEMHAFMHFSCDCSSHSALQARLSRALVSFENVSLFKRSSSSCMRMSAHLHPLSRLLQILHNKYLFLEHLQAIRRYLLLGQGDLIRHLMSLLE